MTEVRVLLAFSIEQAERLSLKNPDAIVLDYDRQVIWRDGMFRRLSLTQYRFAFHVLTRCGGVATKEDAFEELYGDRRDGGPVSHTRMMDVLLCKIRKILKPLGITFKTQFTLGIYAELHPILNPEPNPFRSVP